MLEIKTPAAKCHNHMWRRLLPATVALTLFFGMFAYLNLSATESYAATKTYNVTVTVKMGKNGSNCPVLYFKQGAEDKALAYGAKFYVDGKIFDQWTKSKTWFKKNRVTVVFTSVKLPAGTYKVVCDNGSKTKTLIKNLGVKQKMKKMLSF